MHAYLLGGIFILATGRVVYWPGLASMLESGVLAGCGLGVKGAGVVDDATTGAGWCAGTSAVGCGNVVSTSGAIRGGSGAAGASKGGVLLVAGCGTGVSG